MAFATAADLATFLRRDFSATETDAAALIVEGVEARVRVIGGVTRAAEIEADTGSPQFTAIRDVILTLSGVRFPNPESVMQKRMGGDYSVSFADSSEAARAFSRQELDMIRGAFAQGRALARSIRLGSPWI